MPPDEELVRIVEWPKDRALLDHRFEADAPAHVVVRSDEQPFQVEMGMNLSARDVIPVCIKVCEPICAESAYTIAIDIFDRPVAAITIKGLTRLFNCGDEGRPGAVGAPG
ncbi:MAG: hypothetical protein QOF27_1177 [Gaiellaceae bacterium]|jgi:hypothetical protein|nr:hypothetical protein [Gaiellaceae bacterium]